MNRLLTFHYHGTSGSQERMAPSAYYMDADFTKVAVRIYAGVAPTSDAKFDIFDDGVSIFQSRDVASIPNSAGVISTVSEGTSIVLLADEQSDEIAENFTETPIAKGSWVTCNMLDSGDGKDFTVQLELQPLSEDDESEE